MALLRSAIRVSAKAIDMLLLRSKSEFFALSNVLSVRSKSEFFALSNVLSVRSRINFYMAHREVQFGFDVANSVAHRLKIK